MSDLARRGPLGLKKDRPGAKPRKGLPPRSPRKIAHKAAEAALGGIEHILAVKALPCVCCGAHGPSEAHHVRCDKQPRSDFRVLPLCASCHRGPDGYHAAKRSWRERYGRDCDLLPRVDAMLAAQRKADPKAREF